MGNATAQKYDYNGKEYQEEMGLNWSDYGWRNYDATIGRWMNAERLRRITNATLITEISDTGFMSTLLVTT